MLEKSKPSTRMYWPLVVVYHDAAAAFIPLVFSTTFSWVFRLLLLRLSMNAPTSIVQKPRAITLPTPPRISMSSAVHYPIQVMAIRASFTSVLSGRIYRLHHSNGRGMSILKRLVRNNLSCIPSKLSLWTTSIPSKKSVLTTNDWRRNKLLKYCLW